MHCQRSLMCGFIIFGSFSLDCDWFELVGTEFELTPSQLWCSNTSIFTWVCLNDPIQPRWLKFASLCLGSDSNLFEPAFRRQAWKFRASANSKWCSRQFQRLDKFETICQIRGFGQLKITAWPDSRLWQFRNDAPDKFGASTNWKWRSRQIRGLECGGDGRVGELVPRHGIGENWIEAGLSISPLSYIWSFSQFWKNIFLILESNSSESIGRGSINSLTLISPFLQLLLVAKIILNKLIVQPAVHNFIIILILIIIWFFILFSLLQ